MTLKEWVVLNDSGLVLDLAKQSAVSKEGRPEERRRGNECHFLLPWHPRYLRISPLFRVNGKISNKQKSAFGLLLGKREEEECMYQQEKQP
jgi:hypothetical protein